MSREFLGRIRTGVGKLSDGWHVIVRINDDPPDYSPASFRTEAEAWDAAKQVAAAFRRQAKRDGLEMLTGPDAPGGVAE